MIKKPTKEQIKYIADNIYCWLDDDQLLDVVDAVINEWEKIRNLNIKSCNCKNSNLDIIEQNDDINKYVCVIICNNCKKFSTGKTKKEAIEKWNKMITNKLS